MYHYLGYSYLLYKLWNHRYLLDYLQYAHYVCTGIVYANSYVNSYVNKDSELKENEERPEINEEPDDWIHLEK